MAIIIHNGALAWRKMTDEMCVWVFEVCRRQGGRIVLAAVMRQQHSKNTHRAI